MKLSVAILGASGVYGRHLIPRVVARGHRVRALVRNPDAAHVARACGAEAIAADTFDEASLIAGVKGCDVAINLATALRDAVSGEQYAQNDRVRTEGAPIFLRACEAAAVSRVIQQSIAMAHGAGQDWADENAPPARIADPVGAAALEAAITLEHAVKQSALDWTILSGGLFYGPGTGFDDRWRAAARAGKLRLPGDGSDFVSLIHIADMAAATLAAIERPVSRETLIVTDDAPAQWRDVFGHLAASMGAPAPQAGGRQGFPSFRMRNRRARDALTWAPFYSDYRMGLAV